MSTLPRRLKLAEPGSVELPRFVFSWLTDSVQSGDWTVLDVGVLTALLLSFANEDASIIHGARFENADEERVLVVPGGVGSSIRFAGQLGGSPLDDERGHVRMRPALQTLVRNKWLVVEHTTAETRIRLGERAPRLIEEREQTT